MSIGLPAAAWSDPATPQKTAGEIAQVQTRLAADAENLLAAEINPEDAMRLALQTRRDLALTSLPLAADAERNALTSFSSG